MKIKKLMLKVDRDINIMVQDAFSGSKWAIGDVHGCPKTLKALLNKLNLKKIDRVFFLGDYINKGPDSKGVLDILIKLQMRGYKITCIIGNNDQKLLDAVKFKAYQKIFEDKYPETLQSFGVKSVLDIPHKYLMFIRSMPKSVELKKHVLVHGDAIPMDIGERKLLQGHVPTPLLDIRAGLKGKLIKLDGGITKDGMGLLIAYNLTAQKVVKQKNIDGFKRDSNESIAETKQHERSKQAGTEIGYSWQP